MIMPVGGRRGGEDASWRTAGGEQGVHTHVRSSFRRADASKFQRKVAPPCISVFVCRVFYYLIYSAAAAAPAAAPPAALAADHDSTTCCCLSAASFFSMLYCRRCSMWYCRLRAQSACAIGGVNCLRLIHEHTATALAYGIYKSAKGEFHEKVLVRRRFSCCKKKQLLAHFTTV